MDSLMSLAAKVKSSPQVIRKVFARPYDRGSYFKASEEENGKGKFQEDWLHTEESLKEGVHFYAKMLGSCPVFQAQGAGCTDEAVQTIVANTKKAMNTLSNESLQKVLMTVSSRKLIIEDMISKEKIIEIPIYRVSSCATDPNINKVFAFISRAQDRHDLTCYALLCGNNSMAKAMALTIADAFKFAFINHEKGKADRDQGSSPVAKEDNKKSTQHDTPVVNSGKTDIHRNLTTTTLAPLDAPLIQLTADSSSSTVVEDSGNRMQALDLAVDYNEFDAEFTKLAESRSNPILFETPVRRRDFSGDLSDLVATEATAKELMMSKSTDDLFV